MKKMSIVLIITFLATVCSIGAASAGSLQDEITLPNSEVEAIVREAAGLDDDEPITKEAVAWIFRLDLSGTGLVSIDFLADFTSLELLDLTDNTISDITALAELEQLERLYLRDNSAGDIAPLAGL